MVRNLLLLLYLQIVMQLSGNAQVGKDSVWIQTSDGCKIHNPHPVKNETVTWSGECIGGYAIGEGTLVWFKSGKRNQEYFGTMKRGIPQGQGRYVFDDGTVREGTYIDGVLHGIGTITELHKNGGVSYIYHGQLQSGKIHGSGREIFFSEQGDTSQIYSGYFFDGLLNGEGTSKHFNGTDIIIVKGNYDDGYVAGYCEIYEYRKTLPVSHYKGEFFSHARSGHGEQVHGSNRYVGQWSQNNRKGMGKLYLDTMLVYDGEWNNDKFEGKGMRFFFDGSIYYGDLQKNLRHGFGKQTFKDGTTFVGEFRRDLYTGLGFFLRGEEIIACGRWKDGRLESKQDYKSTREALLVKHKVKFASLDQFDIGK